MIPNSYRELRDHHLGAGTEEGAFLAEIQAGIQGDKTGRGFIYEMFFHELALAGYARGDNLTKILRPLGLTPGRVHSTPPLFNGLKMAMEDYMDDLAAAQGNERND